MVTPLRKFIRQFVGVVAAALVPVLIVAFLTDTVHARGSPRRAAAGRGVGRAAHDLNVDPPMSFDARQATLM